MASSLEQSRCNLRGLASLAATTFLTFLFLWQVLIPTGRRIMFLATAQSKSIAGHRVFRVFNEANSPIGHLAPSFKPGKLFYDGDHRLWVAPASIGERMVATFEETTGRWMLFGERQDITVSTLNYRPGALIPYRVKRIAESRSGEMWFVDKTAYSKTVSSKPYLTSFDGKSWQVHDIAKNTSGFIQVGLFSDRGTLWFWAGEELWSYDGKLWTRIFDSLKNLPPSHRVIGTAPQEERRHYGNGPYEIFDVMKDREGLWWFALGGGIRRFDDQKKEWKMFPQIPMAVDIFEDKLGRLWFGDTFSVSVYNKTSDSIREFRFSDHFSDADCGDAYPGLNCIYQDKRGQMLFGHGCGLVRYDEAKEKWDLVSLADIGLANEVEDIVDDRDGRIWISTRSGLVVLDP